MNDGPVARANAKAATMASGMPRTTGGSLRHAEVQPVSSTLAPDGRPITHDSELTLLGGVLSCELYDLWDGRLR